MQYTKTRLGFTLLACSSLILTACSTSPEAQLAKQKQAEFEQRAKDRDQALKATPAWYLETKITDINGSLGRGTGFSRDMQMAFDEATLQAQAELSRNTKLLFSEQFKAHRRNNGLTGEVSMQLSATADRYLPEVDVSGAKALRRELKAERDGFRAYVLLHLDVTERDREKMANAALELAHQELMQRNARYRAEQSAVTEAAAAQ